MRRFAQDTTVAISKSRQDIQDLLLRWSCQDLGWLDRFDMGIVLLQFVIPRKTPGKNEAILYRAQFSITLETEAKIRLRCTGARGLAEGRFRDAMNRRGRREHRVLYLWLKAALEAVTEGIIPFEAIFLPFFVREDGRTVHEVALPFLPKMMAGSIARMLTAGATSNSGGDPLS